MAHSLAEIEDDALRLPPEDRARLAVDLLASLEESVESPEEIEKLWLAEAERRFQEVRDCVQSCARDGGNIPPGGSDGSQRVGGVL
jgi:hypothetical protein